MMTVAEYSSSIELNEKAIKYYQYAQSLAKDDQIKSKALTAIGHILKKDKTKQGDEYIKNAAEHNYFNYASFNQQEVLKNILYRLILIQRMVLIQQMGFL